MTEIKEKKPFDWKNLGTRVMGAAMMLAILIPALIVGRVFWFAVISFVAIAGTYEFYKAFGIEKRLCGILGYFSACVYLILLYF